MTSSTRLIPIAALVLAVGCAEEEPTPTNNGATNNGTTSTNNDTGQASEVGKRCTDDDDCAGDLVCFTEFFGERPVCTRECGAVLPCPDGSECVGGVSDYNGQALGPRCLTLCEVDANCAPLGSECDMHETTGVSSYCF